MPWVHAMRFLHDFSGFKTLGKSLIPKPQGQITMFMVYDLLPSPRIFTFNPITILSPLKCIASVEVYYQDLWQICGALFHDCGQAQKMNDVL